MGKTVKVTRLALIGSAPLLMVSGMVLKNNGGEQLTLVHALLGIVLALSLWTIAGIAARAGVSAGIVALAVSWSLVAIVLGAAQEGLLAGSTHWVIQVLHIATSIGMIAWGQILLLLMRRTHGRMQRSRASTSEVEPAPLSAPLSR